MHKTGSEIFARVWERKLWKLRGEEASENDTAGVCGRVFIN